MARWIDPYRSTSRVRKFCKSSSMPGSRSTRRMCASSGTCDGPINMLHATFGSPVSPICLKVSSKSFRPIRRFPSGLRTFLQAFTSVPCFAMRRFLNSPSNHWPGCEERCSLRASTPTDTPINGASRFRCIRPFLSSSRRRAFFASSRSQHTSFAAFAALLSISSKSTSSSSSGSKYSKRRLLPSAILTAWQSCLRTCALTVPLPSGSISRNASTTPP
mmetsp:Transcript_10161/g.19622  ORF Transcript_10161/g.19622 Transcript_10161/m.19622 type:complete len:218 (+) Transcript_10161:327-980(+)